METADNVVAINEQKVTELEIRVKQLTLANVQLLVAKLQIEAIAIDNAQMYLNERAPHLHQELAVAQAKFAELTKNDHK